MEQSDDFDDDYAEKMGRLYVGEHPKPDPLIVDQLRQAATAGQSTSQLLARLQALTESTKTSTHSTGEYFEEAFAWTFGETLRLRTWRGAWTDEMIDTHYAALLEEWKTNPRKRGEQE